MNPFQYAEAVAAEVRAEMGRQNKSRADLAQVLGITSQTAATRLSGAQPFDMVELAQVAEWLGVAPEKLAPSTRSAAAS